MNKIPVKHISSFLILILMIYSLSSLIPVSLIIDEVYAANNIGSDEILRGLGIAVLLYFVSKIGQRLIDSDISAENTGAEVDLLARVIYAEARGEPFKGQVAVGAVVINRLKSRNFPDNINDIIFSERQFTSVDDGQIYYTPDQTAYNAAREVLAGKDPTGGALYFYNPDTANPNGLQWLLDNTTAIKRIGDHVFAR